MTQFLDHITPECAENVQIRFNHHVVVKQPEGRDFAQFLTNGHFTNGGIANQY